MMQKILALVAIFADILTILSVWGINEESPLWLKIVITIIAIVIGIVMVVLTHDAYDIKVKDIIIRKRRMSLEFIQRRISIL